MLSREKRLVKKRDYDRVYQKGKRVHSEKFNISFLPNRSNLTRVGIVVGKKFSKKAVERNRAKRLCREAVRELGSKIQPGYDVVIFVKKVDLTTTKTSDIRQEIGKLLERGGLLR